MLNKAILMGRLVRDPEKRYTQGNTDVASFTLAIDRNRKDQNGSRQTSIEVNCEEISFGETKKSREQGGASRAGSDNFEELGDDDDVPFL